MVLLPPKVHLRSDEQHYMFSPDLLTDDVTQPVPEDIIVRPLSLEDYDSGFLQLLSQLTHVGEISREDFATRFNSMARPTPQAYFIVALQQKSTGRVVGAATLVLEWKFIHEAGARGRIEDVVIHNDMRGRRLGALINRVLVALARKFGVYKLSLECKDALIPFYELNGFKKDVGNNFLVQRFDTPCLSGEPDYLLEKVNSVVEETRRSKV